ncbi:alpha/beta hydrolase [Parvularcula sp. ZS-1/3]|uniref:Alpha/beta hydrolase n=1 Tax=Parvularcula mediterranea TaxID=2732508 RepID=A0A7Y3RM81_9PROT|nr:alpha/beta hydrolase [Parvularcula mediterranea]NNU16151.1 alpha/beta hydrolase [Parvularcula mediterranea]
MRRFLLIILAVIVAGALGAVGFVWLNMPEPAELSEVEAAYLTEDDRYLDIDGAKVRIREQGPADAPVLLMIHGFTFSLESWDQLADRLDDDFRVVRYDLLGHGLTGPDAMERYAPDERAAFASRVIETLGLEKPVLVGNSLGGLVSWKVAAARPDQVAALVLISPGAYSINGVGDEPVPVPAPVAFYLKNAPEAAVRASFGRIYADPSAVSDERVALAAAMMRREGNGVAFVKSLEEFVLPNPDEDLSRIEAPTLILWGAEDLIVPPEHGPLIEAQVPNARLITYAGVGHVAQEEVPDRVADDLRRFLFALDQEAEQP